MRSKCGEHTRYNPGCTPCRVASREYAAHRARGLAEGTWERVLTGEAVERARADLLRLLADPDVSVPRVAQALGIFNSTLYRLKLGRAHQIHAFVGAGLAELTPERVLGAAGPRLVDATGVTRRLQALAAEGWTLEALSSVSGIHTRTLGHWRVGRRPTITPVNRARVVDLYDKVMAQADPRGPSEEARDWARRQGYLPPERWADEDIDDPLAQPLPPEPDTPDHVEIRRIVDDCLRQPSEGKAAGLDIAVRREIARHAADRLGWPHTQIAWLMGYKSAGQVGYLLNGRADRRGGDDE